MYYVVIIGAPLTHYGSVNAYFVLDDPLKYKSSLKLREFLRAIELDSTEEMETDCQLIANMCGETITFVILNGFTKDIEFSQEFRAITTGTPEKEFEFDQAMDGYPQPIVEEVTFGKLTSSLFTNLGNLVVALAKMALVRAMIVINMILSIFKLK